MSERGRPAAALVALALLLAGCSATRMENVALAPGEANPERRSLAPDDPDDPALFITFSGGGTRAAALAESVLRELRGVTYAGKTGPRRLTDDVKLVSSVSGGSVTAAWFGLMGADGLDALRSRFLVQDNMAALELEAVDPVTWLKLVFGDFTRIGAEEQLFDRTLFEGKTLARLNQPGRPIVILNATDMAGEESFGFTPQRFDDICSSYDRMPISTAVAASAAFPILLSPVDFENYSAHCQGSLGSLDWARTDLANPYTPLLNLPEYRAARYANDLRRGPEPFRDIRYIHLLDGGLADNMGVAALRQALTSPFDAAGGLRAINEGRIRRLVVILVKASSDPPNALYRQRDRPGTIDMLNTVTSAPIDANSANSQIVLDTLLTELAKAADGARALAGARFAGMTVYGITIDFDQIPADTEAHRRLRDAAKDVPTSWTLTPAQLELTESLGPFLLRRQPCYQELLADLGVPPPPDTGLPSAEACVTKVTR
jgi:NTE family protein